jgi:hypothetical protein
MLAKQHLKTGKRVYLGRRNDETERIASEFARSKERAKERLKSLKERMEKDERLNKIEGVARAPKELIAIFRKINELGLGNKLIAIGTNALYAYEARCGVFLEQERLATRDIDLLNRKDKGVSFLFGELMVETKAAELVGAIDPSFEKSREVPYRFVNKEGVWLELINPMSDSVKSEHFKESVFGDVVPLAMKGIQWLENSRLFTETVIGENGKCANITTIHPLEYAIYKNWLGKQEDRDYLKHTRDLEQSRLVTRMIVEYMPDIDIEAELAGLKHFKREIVEAYRKEAYLPIAKKATHRKDGSDGTPEDEEWIPTL